MLLKILFWILSPVLLYLTIGLLKDLITVIRFHLQYKKQGIKLHYTPLFGFVKFLMPSSHRDTFHYFKKTLNEDFHDESIVGYTNYDSTRLGFFLKSPELIKEFYVKEVKHTKKVDVVPLPMDLGFFMEHGENALKMRGVFNQFFRPENMRLVTPKIRSIVDEEIGKLKEDIWGKGKTNKDEFVEINLRDFFPKIFNRIVTQILFGDEFPTVDGESVPTASEKLIAFMFTEVLRSPLNTFTFNILQKYNLLPAYKKAQIASQKIADVCNEVIQSKKKNSKDLGEGKGLIDLMIEHNKTAPEDLFISDDKMLANVRLFQVAGQDTSKTATETVMYHLVENMKYLKQLQDIEIPNTFKIMEDNNNYDKYMDNELLHSVFEEAIRLRIGPPMTFPRRVITKNMKIGPYTINRGDELIVPYATLHVSDHYERRNDFYPERFFKKNRGNIDKNMFEPFGLGRRNCAGQNLALIVVKMNIVALLQNFDFEQVEGFKPDFIMRFNYGVEDLKVRLRPKICLGNK